MSEEARREIFQFISVLGMLTSILSVMSGILFVTENPISFICTVMTFMIIDLLIWLNWRYRIVPILNSYEIITCARIIIAIVYYVGAMFIIFGLLERSPIYVMTFISLGAVNTILGTILTISYIRNIRGFKSRFWSVK